MPEVLNAKGRPFSWAFSAIDNFEGCPLRYAHEKFYCTIVFQETEPIKWGNRVHRAGELFLKKVNPGDPEALKPVQRYCDLMLKSGYPLEPELEIALNRNLQPVKWFSKDAWFRLKIDVVLTKPAEKAVVVYDWKTGKRIKENDDQIMIALAILAMQRPELISFFGGYIWTQHSMVIPVGAKMVNRLGTQIVPTDREYVLRAWNSILPRVQRIEEAWVTGNFPARRSGLCSWCQISPKYCIHKR